MKNFSKLIIGSAALSAVSIASLAADYTWNGETWGYWIDGYQNGETTIPTVTTWYSNGSPLAGAPTWEDSFSYDGDKKVGIYIMGKDLANLQGGDATLYMKSLNISSTSTEAMEFVTISGGIAGWQMDSAKWVPVTMNVKENVTLKAAGDVNFATGETGSGFDRIIVGGDIDATGVDGWLGFGFSWKHGADKGAEAYSESNIALKVGGVINLGSGKMHFQQGSRFSPTGEQMYPSVQLGGLVGNGAVIANDDKNVFGSTFVFKVDDGGTFKGGTFSGGFADRWRGNGDSGYSDTTVNIIMADTSNGGRQNIILTLAAGDKDDRMSSPAAINVEIRSGKMGLGNTATADKFAKVEIKGGELSVAGDDKTLYVKELVLAGGDLVFNVFGGGNSDSITADSLSGTGTQIFMDLSMADFDVDDDLSGFAFEILKGVSGSGLDVAFRYGGELQNFVWHWDGGKVVVDSGVVVPEPAAFAALFGAIAISLAAYRRRK